MFLDDWASYVLTLILSFTLSRNIPGLKRVVFKHYARVKDTGDRYETVSQWQQLYAGLDSLLRRMREALQPALGPCSAVSEEVLGVYEGLYCGGGIRVGSRIE